jgi:hypothetical protein
MIRSDDSNQAEQLGRAARRGSTTVAACRSDSPACLADGARDCAGRAFGGARECEPVERSCQLTRSRVEPLSNSMRPYSHCPSPRWKNVTARSQTRTMPLGGSPTYRV